MILLSKSGAMCLHTPLQFSVMPWEKCELCLSSDSKTFLKRTARKERPIKYLTAGKEMVSVPSCRLFKMTFPRSAKTAVSFVGN